MICTPDCASCPYAVDGKPPHRPVASEGDGSKAIGVVVGEGPSFEDADEGLPLKGRDGQGLSNELTEVALPRAHLLTVLATACRAPMSAKVAERRKAARCCAPLFESRVAVARKRNLPALVLGSLAAHAWSGTEMTVDDKRGFVRELETGAQWVLTWPPSFALFRAPYEGGNFANDVARFGRMVRGTLERAPRIVTAPTLRDFKEMCKSVEPVAVDVETAPETVDAPWTGKDPRVARLRTVGLGNTQWGLSIEARRLLLEPRILETARDFLTGERLKVLMNGPWFDNRVLGRYKLPIRNFKDVRDMRRAVSSVSRLSLRYLVSIYTDFPPWKEQEADDGEKVVFTRDVTQLKTYNALDCVGTARVYRGLLRDLASERVA